MIDEVIELHPGKNRIRVLGVQMFGTVEPKEFTESGYPKNTVTDLGEITMIFDVKTKKFSVVNK